MGGWGTVRSYPSGAAPQTVRRESAHAPDLSRTSVRTIVRKDRSSFRTQAFAGSRSRLMTSRQPAWCGFLAVRRSTVHISESIGKTLRRAEVELTNGGGIAGSHLLKRTAPKDEVDLATPFAPGRTKTLPDQLPFHRVDRLVRITEPGVL